MAGFYNEDLLSPHISTMISPVTDHTGSTSLLDFGAYWEDEDFLAQGEPEPSVRSQTLVYHHERKKWWIKVTLIGSITSISNERKVSKRERRKEFQDFAKVIDYGSLTLLDNTVTEVILREEPEPATVIRLEMTDKVELTDGFFQVYRAGVPYILKIIYSPFYQPRDTDVMRNELENLEYFQGISNIVQAAGIAVDINPYTTSTTGEQVVVGALLQFYSGGSLRQVLDDGRISEHHWEQWALRIGTILRLFHAAGRTHMDIKCSNIMLDGGGDAVLIDISGIGGTTHEWCAPEIRDEISPFDLPFEARRLNDIWAYGKLLSEIASHAGSGPHAIALKQVAGCLMREDTTTRIGISEAMSRLEATIPRCTIRPILT
ncbi:protein kinase domain-containing protein [Microsporum canis CBS 113480]|uniref:Protein kinase domain-containing protein n=1 Tax=Arthroderma otae (strain ATCC MYA-4605 / CBS 113480) TaxID=554155 RepID=C5G051_ARTOC|nr:protein kinase domain-containing protein [Microsporum canis CBS 113480]EEQ35504.1 protein kinase domain-containing protein [Microsporum canis CBS 113480]